MLTAAFVANCLVLADLLMVEARHNRLLDIDAIGRASEIYLSELEYKVPKVSDRLELLLEVRNEHTDALTGSGIKRGLQACHEEIIGSPYDIQRYISLEGGMVDLDIDEAKSSSKPTKTDKEKISEEETDPINTGRRIERALSKAREDIKKLWRRPTYLGAMISDQIKSAKPSTDEVMKLEPLLVEVYLTPAFLVGDAIVAQSSGNYEFDVSAVNAIKRAKHFPSFSEFSTKLYNERLRKFTIRFTQETPN